MSFVGRKVSLGPRGRNASTSPTSAMTRQVRAMGYVQDDHAFTRGPGAIAALDGASARRRRARARALGADALLDARRAQMTIGAKRTVVGSGGGTLLPGMKAGGMIIPGAVQGKTPQALVRQSRTTKRSPFDTSVTQAPRAPSFAPIGRGFRMTGVAVPGAPGTSSPGTPPDFDPNTSTPGYDSGSGGGTSGGGGSGSGSGGDASGGGGGGGDGLDYGADDESDDTGSDAGTATPDAASTTITSPDPGGTISPATPASTSAVGVSKATKWILAGVALWAGYRYLLKE